MNWKEYWNSKAKANSSLARVGREDDTVLFERTLAHLKDLVNPNQQMTLLDLCCGNGLVSQFFAPKVDSLVGVDLSPLLLKEAQDLNKNYPNSAFFCADASNFHHLIKLQFDVVLLHFSFQYFETKTMATEVFNEVAKCLKPGGKLVITDIPDARKQTVFYPGILGYLRRVKQKLTNTREMGRFWDANELKSMAESEGFEVEILQQHNSLAYSHYRFDVILKRKH